MNKVDVPLFEIYWDEDDINAVNNVIRSGRGWADGSIISDFEASLAKYHGSKYCVAFNSGTSAQTSVLQAYGISKKDEVIVPSFTFISTVNTVLHLGAKPVFADIEKQNYNIDPNSLKNQINNKTRLVSPVHYAGGHSSIDEIEEICEANELILLEDNAEAMGHEYNGKLLGTIGDSSILSFCQNKIITTGEGGAILTKNEEIYEKLKLIRSHGRSSSDYFTSGTKAEYILPGYNYRMPSMNAALGISQLNKIDNLISMRRSIADKYKKGLQNIEEIEIIQKHQRNHVYQLFPIIVKFGIRDKLQKYLSKNGVSSKVYFNPVHETEFYKKFGEYNLPITEEVGRCILNLPIYPGMTDLQIDHVIEKIDSFFKM